MADAIASAIIIEKEAKDFNNNTTPLHFSYISQNSCVTFVYY